MKVLVLGLGISGRAAANFLIEKGVEVVGIDGMDQGVFSFPVYKEMNPDDIEQYDQLVVSPGISPSHPVYSAAKDLGVEVIGEIELGLRHLSNRVVAITGTNGKTTVTELVVKGLNDGGVEAIAAGNYGLPLTELITNKIKSDVVIVLELSSFQLETMSTKGIDAAAILNITPDHLDRYRDFFHYADTKLSLYHLLKKGAPLYLESKITDRYSNQISHTPIFTIPSKGTHDERNALFAKLLTAHFGISENSFEKTLAHFQKPKHRLEYLQTINGIAYYNDSKGTNVDAVIKAVESMKTPVYLIAGGKDKGVAFDCWVQPFHHKVRGIFAFGEAKVKIQQALANHYPVTLIDNLEEAVTQASKAAKPGEVVLLSPGCSSLDSYRNYAERGEHFELIVSHLHRGAK